MSKRILVMEDEKDNRQIIRDLLGGIDCEITEAEDAEQALAAIAKERPDLILMGIHLPIMNGYTVTRQIKANPALRSIPVIAITSHALAGEEHIARAAGCDDYVPEPYSPALPAGKNSSVLAPIDRELLHCICPLLAQSGHSSCTQQCPLLGVKRTSLGHRGMSAWRTASRTHVCPLSGRLR